MCLVLVTWVTECVCVCLCVCADADMDNLDIRLQILKIAILKTASPVPVHVNGKMEKVAMFLRHAWPPSKPLQILRVWHKEARLGYEFLQKFSPGSRFLISGHTHFAGVRKIKEKWMINLGSFSSGMNKLSVLISDNKLHVEKPQVVGGEFVPGRPIKSFQLKPAR